MTAAACMACCGWSTSYGVSLFAATTCSPLPSNFGGMIRECSFLMGKSNGGCDFSGDHSNPARSIGPRSSSVAILDFRSRRLADPTISRPDHKAGIVIRAGGEIGFEIGQLLPLQFELGLECEGFANTWLIGGYTPAGILQPTSIIVLLGLEIGQSMLKASNCAERRDRDCQVDLLVGAGARQHSGVAMPVPAEALA